MGGTNLHEDDPVLGGGCFCHQMRAEGYREVCPYCIATKDWSRKPSPVEIASATGVPVSEVIAATEANLRGQGFTAQADRLAAPPKGAGDLPSRLMGDVNSIPDAELIHRVISGQRQIARSSRTRTVPLWSKVGDRFCLGSNYAMQLCRRFGFDPDEQVRL